MHQPPPHRLSAIAALGFAAVTPYTGRFDRMPDMNRPRTTRLAILALAFALLLGGCGQKGPLYLPDEQEQQQEEE